MCQERLIIAKRKKDGVSYRRLFIVLFLVSALLTVDEIGRALSTRFRALTLSSLTESQDITMAVSNKTFPKVAEKDWMSFSLENLDFSHKVQCGAFKCFFISTDPSLGYLVSLDRKYNEMVHQWETSKYIGTNYGVKTVLLSPPERSTISAEMAHTMVKRGGLNKMLKKEMSKHHPVQVVTQKSGVVPEGFLHFYCMCHNLNPGCLRDKDTWLTFRKSINETTFLLQFDEELKAVKTLIDKEPWFGFDFQVLIGRDGSFFIIDVSDDRAGFGWMRPKYPLDKIRNMCFNAFGELESLVNEHFVTIN